MTHDKFWEIVKVGSRIVLLGEAGRSRGGSYEIAATSDLGKTWTSTVWSFGATATLEVVGGVPILAIRREHALITVPLDVLGPDLPRWTLASLDATPLTACSASTLADVSAATSVSGGVEITVSSKSGKGAQATLEDVTRYVRVGADGTPCVALVTADEKGTGQVVIAPHDLHDGYVLKQDQGKVSWAALSCSQ